jgi:hypothetical protein
MVTAAKQPGRNTSKKASWVGWLVLGLLVAPCVIFGLFDGSDSTDVPAPAADERADTVPLLREATASQGLCYGWVLKDYWKYGDDVISAGSNLGDGVRVEENVSCPQWVQVTATIRYVSDGESSDTARVAVTGSPDLDAADLWQMQRGLERFGLTDKVFIDDPGWAITRAAVMLPLLATEAGPAEPAAAPSPLPTASNDLWRDRWGYLIAVVGLLLLAALFITVGVVQRRRQLRGVVPAQRAGADPAPTRTPEKA